MSAPAFDARPLTDSIDRRAMRAHLRQMRAQGRGGSVWGASSVQGVIVLIVFGVFTLAVMGVFVSTAVGIASALVSTGGTSAALVLLPPVFVLGIAALIAFLIVRALRSRGEREYRLDRFAVANAMSYVSALAAPALPGIIFGVGSSRRASDLVRGARPRFVEFANYRYTTGSGKNRTTHRWGYVAVRLDTPLPHILLDATGNNGLFGSSLPTSFDRDQRLRLEGDFDRYFSLFCPRGYERDALYLFTPDIMARFIDHAAELDVEIVDDWLFLYAKRDLSTLDPATWAWLFSVVRALLDKLDQWSRWRDDRLTHTAAVPVITGPTPKGPDAAVTASGPALSLPAAQLRPPPGVAPEGRRLTRGVSWLSIAAVVVVVAFWVFTIVL
jgi:hypothetical protein